jgi:predicted MPP superfamily phosphohydrolase
MANGRGKHNHFIRTWCELVLDALLCRGLFAKWSYRLGMHGQLVVSEHQLRLSGRQLLPGPIKIGFASDFHAGPTTHPEIFRALSHALQAHQPDLVLLGGDYISCKAAYIDKLIDHLTSYQAPLGTYAVLGNHDLWSDSEYIGARLHQSGIQVLRNQCVDLPEPFDRISVVGLDDPWTGEVCAEQAFVGAKQATILLMHSPDGLLYLDGRRFDLGFAGHTHGGQICVRNGAPIVAPHGPLSRKFVQGRHKIENHGTLFVGRGIGCSNIPVRINASPELIICTLD